MPSKKDLLIEVFQEEEGQYWADVPSQDCNIGGAQLSATCRVIRHSSSIRAHHCLAAACQEVSWVGGRLQRQSSQTLAPSLPASQPYKTTEQPLQSPLAANPRKPLKLTTL